MARILALIVAVLAATAPAQEPQQPTTVPECWKHATAQPVGQQFDAFMACCRGLDVKESECRRVWIEPPVSRLPAPPQVEPEGSTP
jgi:hypothetical protein